MNRTVLPRRKKQEEGYSLVELLLVIGLLLILTALSGPAIQSLLAHDEFAQSVDTVRMTLNRARAYAISHDTWVWVGFYEEDVESQATSHLPPYPGKGKVVLCVVASLDGSSIYEDGATPAAIPGSRVALVGKMVQLENLHVTDVGSSLESGDPITLQGRPGEPYSDPSGDTCRISSDSASQTPFPIQAGKYTFYKTIRFSPAGEANINGNDQLKRLGEIGLVPTSGSRWNKDEKNVAAIQFSGIGGMVQVYRP